ncbi:Leucine-rich repeat protein kinase family protein [Forsythia ovata]|uniref:Leucine-rich repeat protein kinase family protein n=1 Tax=Forsythia ovata TaxID=205694 RepID=A0ABD1RHD9_9LAMI
MASFHFLLVLTLCIFSVSADDVFVSIDCGSSDMHTDENLIPWNGDDLYINNGVNQMVPPANSISRVMDTLRVFMNRKKNCYSIRNFRSGRVLVRASFYYGNYDKKSSPPTFDLQFDGNNWVTVQTSSTGYIYYEAIYVMKQDYISVCVAQTQPNQFPFISALEVRGLDSYMYSYFDENYPLFLVKRVAYGANATVRYIDDIYDRIWTPATAGKGLIEVKSDAIFSAPGLGDNPPPAVLLSAVTAISPSESILLNMGFPPVEVPVYINWYFSEVTQLEANQTRSFMLYKDGQPFYQALSPPYGNFTEIISRNYTVSSNTTFSLVPTNDSTLPPLINAMEVFLIGDALTDGTNSKDVKGLVSLQNAFKDLQDWSGDPCLPVPYTWDWINCSNDATPRVTALYLGSFNLSGTLPDFSSMDALETIDLHNNSLYGTIPDFLGTFPDLKELNLADNQFTGSIPASLAKKNDLKFEVTDNPDLCTSGKSCQSSGNPTMRSSGGKKKNKLPVILGTTISIFVVFWAIVGVFVILQHRRKTVAIAALSEQHGGAQTNVFKVNMEEQVNVDQTNRQGHANVHQDRDLY